MGVIIDTSEFVGAERAGQSAVSVIAKYGPAQDYGISVITVAELQHGIRRADGARRKQMRERFLADVLALYFVYPHEHRNGSAGRRLCLGATQGCQFSRGGNEQEW